MLSACLLALSHSDRHVLAFWLRAVLRADCNILVHGTWYKKRLTKAKKNEKCGSTYHSTKEKDWSASNRRTHHFSSRVRAERSDRDTWQRSPLGMKDKKKYVHLVLI